MDIPGLIESFFFVISLSLTSLKFKASFCFKSLLIFLPLGCKNFLVIGTCLGIFYAKSIFSPFLASFFSIKLNYYNINVLFSVRSLILCLRIELPMLSLSSAKANYTSSCLILSSCGLSGDSVSLFHLPPCSFLILVLLMSIIVTSAAGTLQLS